MNFKTIDLDYLVELSNGDRQFVLEMLLCFEEDVPTYISKILEAYHSNDKQEFKYYVHKLRSPFAFMGIHKGLEILETLEESKQLDAAKILSLSTILEIIAKDALAEVSVANKLV